MADAFSLAVLNSEMADSGVAKNHLREVKAPYLDKGNARPNKRTKAIKMKISILEPDLGRKSAFLVMTSRVSLGHNSWTPLRLNMSRMRWDRYPNEKAAIMRM